VYIDWVCPQIEQKPYITSWVLGGTSRNSEILTIPTSGVLNPSQGTIEEWAYIDPNGVHSANNPNSSILFSVVTVQGSPYAELNQIAIKRSPSTTSWKVIFSNSTGEFYGSISLGNITIPGWYCFGVKWQQGVGGYGYLNGELKGSVSASYLPSEFRSIAYIGSWSVCNIIDDFRISPIARSDADILAAYQSSQPLPLDASTTCKLSFNSTLHANPTVNQVNASFTRSTVAYKQDGTQVGANTPRYEAGKFGQGIMIEEGTTNLWSAPLRIYNNYGADIETSLVSLSETYMGQPIYRLSMKPKTIAARDSLRTELRSHGVAGSYMTYSGGNAYTASIYWRQVGSKTMEVGGTASNVSGWTDIGTYDVGNGWKRSSAKWYDASNRTDNKYWSFRCPTVELNETVYIDWVCPQIEQKPYITSWVLGGTSRNSEILTIPTSGVLNPSQGTIEEWAYIDPNGVHSANTPNSSILFSVVTVQSSPYAELNQIAIKRLASTTSWVVIFSNSTGDFYRSIPLGNITIPGWYCFGVKWQQGVGGYGYLNGELKGSVSASYLPSEFRSIAYIGSWSVCNIIDDFRISPIVRSDADILAAYQSNQPLPFDSYTTCKINFDGSLDAIGIGSTPSRYIYDYNNRLDYIEMPSGGMVDYQYDANGSLIRRTIH
ncbi:MAG: hypothetical protein AAGU27_03885, partial [Dehalobacterium sp.]